MFTKLRAHWHHASRSDRVRMLRFVTMPYPTWSGNLRMYLQILFHFLVVTLVIGNGLQYGLPALTEWWGGSWIVRFLLIVLIVDVLISTLINRISGTLLVAITARKQHELNRLIAHMMTPQPVDPVAEAQALIESQDRAMQEQEQSIHMVHDSDVDPIKNLLDQLEAYDRQRDEDNRGH